MLPTSTFGNRFVIVKFPDTLAYEVNYKVLTETATHTTTGANLWQRGVTMTYLLDGSLPLNFFSSDSNWDADELVAPAGVYASVTQFPSGRKHFCIRL